MGYDGYNYNLMKLKKKKKKRSLAKTFKNTSFQLFALQPSTGKMIKKVRNTRCEVQSKKIKMLITKNVC